MTSNQAAVFVLVVLLAHWLSVRGWKVRAEKTEAQADQLAGELKKYMGRAYHLARKARRRGRELRARDVAARNRRSLLVQETER